MPPHSVIAVLLLAAVAAAAAAGDSHNATASARSSSSSPTLGFLECLSVVRGRSSRAALLSVDDEHRDAFLGRVVGCAKVPVMRGLRAVRNSRGAEVRLWDGSVVLHRLREDADDPREEAAPASRALSDDDDDLATYHDMITQLDRASRAYAMDVEVYPGVTASLGRDARSEDAVNLSFKLDHRGLGVEEGDQGQEAEEAEEETGEDDQGRDVVDDLIEDRQGHKKKKVLKGLKKLKKKLAPYLPLLAIPLAIQLLMLPLYIMALKMMALKSILLGKMTLMLVAFNILRNVQQRQMEDDHNSRVAEEYYGYHDEGIEYGGWVNGRSLRKARISTRSTASDSTSNEAAEARPDATAYRGWSHENAESLLRRRR